MSGPMELLESFNLGIAEAWKALNALERVSIDNKDTLELSKEIEQCLKRLSSMEAQTQRLATLVSVACYQRWVSSERFYVYVCER